MKKIFNYSGSSLVAILMIAIVSILAVSCGDDDDNTANRTVLATPTVTVDDASTTPSSLTFNWNAVPGAVQYLYTLKNGDNILVEEITSATSVTFNDLDEETDYTLSVKAYADVNGEYTPSSELASIVGTTAKSPYPMEIKGTIYRLGIGDEIDGTLVVDQESDGSLLYTLKNWYGEGSKDLNFTFDGTNMVIKGMETSGYTYLYTGLQDPYCFMGYAGYNTIGAWSQDYSEQYSEITKDKAGVIWIQCYYGAYTYSPWAVMNDPNGYTGYTFTWNAQ